MAWQPSNNLERLARAAARGWRYLFPNPSFYGWAVVATCFFCAMLSSPGQSFALSLYLEHLIDDLGVSRIWLSTLYGSMTLAAAICLPLVGRLADRFDGRYYLACVIILLGGACLFFSSVTGWIGVAIAFFLLRLLGQGAIGLGNLTVLVQWFHEYRGRALSVVKLGYAAGEMVFPTIIFGLIAAIGWRGSMTTFAIAYGIVFAPLVLWLIRPRSEQEFFDGADAPEPRAEAPAESNSKTDGAPSEDNTDAQSNKKGFSFGQALRMPGFWMMALCVSVLPMVATAVIFHQVALFESMGWATSLIAPAFVGYAGVRIATTYATGLALERYPSRFGISAGMLLATLALTATSLPIPGTIGSLLYGGGLGGATGILSSSNEIVWPEYYGIRAVGQIKGAVTAIRNASTAIGPPLVAWLVGASENFELAITVLAVVCIITAAIAPFLRPPHTTASK